MNRYRMLFSNRHTVFPVIHVESMEQTQRNAQVAKEAGADGIFLINHTMADEELLAIHDGIADEYPNWWIGVNCLGMFPDQVFSAISPKVNGVWVDNAGIEEDEEEQPYAEHVNAIRQANAPNSLYFGGVAFKYQRPVEDLEAACRVAARYLDVVTTSGPGTGMAAEQKKIQRMREALGITPLAIAIGITPENIGDYLPIADSFLVATGISRSFTDFDPPRVRTLIEKIRAFEG